jgi:amino acid permease
MEEVPKIWIAARISSLIVILIMCCVFLMFGKEVFMDWLQVIVIIGSLGTFTLWLFNKLDSDIKTLGIRQDTQIARLDQLYHMYCEMQKDYNDKFEKTNEKFYQLLKEKIGK